jgi:HEAT repeat protein
MDGIIIGSLLMVLASPPIARGSSESIDLQGVATAPAQGAPEFLARWSDQRNRKLVQGALWTASHSGDVDAKTGAVLESVHRHAEAISNGDRSALEPGAIKAFKQRLSGLLEDEHQGMRALAAVLLGVCGDKSYARRIAVLLGPGPVTGDLPRFDRGRAAIALGLLGAQEYTLDIAALLKSSNSLDRSGAAFGLGALRAREHEKSVAQLLNDAEEHVREAAQESLAMMREPPR